MKKFSIILLFFILIPTLVKSGHLNPEKELKIKTISSRESIALAKHLRSKGVKKYSAYWCPNCLYQGELFGKEAYKELIVIECAQDAKNSQTQLCIEKNISGFPSWEIDGKILLGVQTLNDLSKLSGYKFEKIN